MTGSEHDENALIVFQDRQIRRVWDDDDWYISVIDIVAVLTDQDDPLKARKYWNKLKQRLKEEGSEVVTICHQLKMPAATDKDDLCLFKQPWYSWRPNTIRCGYQGRHRTDTGGSTIDSHKHEMNTSEAPT